jgi:hypothetical protein
VCDKLSSKFEPVPVDENARVLMRVGGQMRARVSTLINSHPGNSMSFIWNDNMREKREVNANAT